MRAKRNLELLSPARKETPRLSGKKKALVFGAEAGGRPLPGALADARRLAAILEARFGFEVRHLAGAKATFDAFDEWMHSEVDSHEQHDQLILFFACHGEPGVLIPAPAPGDPSPSRIRLGNLKRRCVRSRSQQILIVIDACYGGGALIRDSDLETELSGDPETDERVRQILCSCRPEEPTEDASAFFEALNHALLGDAGIQEGDGVIGFHRLHHYVRERVSERTDREVQGGNLAGTTGSFRLQSTVELLDTLLVRRLASPDHEPRLRSLVDLQRKELLEGLAQASLEQAARLVCAVLRSSLPGSNEEKLARLPSRRERRQRRHERCAALSTLCRIVDRSLAAGHGVPIEQVSTAALRETTLDFDSAVRRRAALCLRRYVRRGVTKPNEALPDAQASPSPRAKRWRREAGSLIDPTSLPLRHRLRLPQTLCGLALHAAWQALTWTPVRSGASTIFLGIPLIVYSWIAATYYLDATSYNVVVRSGHPRLQSLPGVGVGLVATDFTSSDLDTSRVPSQRIAGSWLKLHRGTFDWARRWADHAKPSVAAMTYWRLGDRAAALEHLARGIELLDAETVSALGYIALQDTSLRDAAVDLLVKALSDEEGPRDESLASLRLVTGHGTWPVAPTVSRLSRRLESLPASEAAATLLAIDLLSGVESTSPDLAATLMDTLDRTDSSSMRRAILGLLSSLTEEEPDVLTALLPQLLNAAALALELEKPILLELLSRDFPAGGQAEELVATLDLLVASAPMGAQLDGAERIASLLNDHSELRTSRLGVLVEQLATSDDEARLDAIRELLAMSPGPAQRRQAESALSALFDRSFGVQERLEIVGVFEVVDSDSLSQTSTRLLLRAAADVESSVRRYALEVATRHVLKGGMKMVPLEPFLRAGLTDPSQRVRQEAALGLVKLADRLSRPPIEAYEVVASMLTAEDHFERRLAVSSAQELDQASFETRRMFIEWLLPQALEAPDLRMSEIVTTPEELVDRTPELLPQLLLSYGKLLTDSPSMSSVPGRVLQALYQRSSRKDTALDPLFRALSRSLSDGDWRERGGLSWALAVLSRYSPEHSRRLSESLDEYLAEEHSVEAQVLGRRALGALVMIGRPVPLGRASQLISGLAHPESPVRRATAEQLRDVYLELQHEQTVPQEMLSALSDPSSYVRSAVAESLAASDFVDNRATRHLAEILAMDPVINVRLQAARALAGLPASRQDQLILKTCREALSPDSKVWSLALSALARLAQSSPETLPSVLEIYEREMEEQRQPRLQLTLVHLRDLALGDEFAATAIVAALGRRLRQPDWPGRWDAVANGLQPIARKWPELAGPASEHLLQILESGGSTDRDRLVLRTASEAAVETLATAESEGQERIWDLLQHESSSLRALGRRALLETVYERPMTEVRQRLRKLKERALLPHRRLSAAKAEEMLEILARSQQLYDEEARLRWYEALDALPNFGTQYAARRSMDHLKPGVRHAP